MTESQPSLNIAPPQIVIIASGDTPSSQANAKGHLFERFVARIFEAYGCEKPSSSNLNVRQNGYEVDIVTRLRLTNEVAIAECKAYSSPLPINALTAFYGKLGAERLDNSSTHGWFIAIPGLTAEGHQLARKLEEKDKRFRVVTAVQIYDLVLEKNWITPISAADNIAISDHAILIVESGMFALAKQLDPITRLPVRVLVNRKSGTLSQSDLSLLGTSDYSSGLPVLDFMNSHLAERSSGLPDLPTLVTVVGSKEDFEYQFPAAPAFFVGREEPLARVKRMYEGVDPRGQIIVLNAQSGWGKSSLALRLAHQVELSGGFALVFDTRTAISSAYVAAALQKAIMGAVAKRILSLPEDFSFASLQSALRTLQTSIWRSSAPLLVFFDQFENVFRDQRLTQEFRDLALSVRELSAPVLLGFSWKTDSVGLTENYPFRLRDEIRGASLVINVDPFGPKDVGTLLNRLARTAGKSLSNELKQRLREYSQGLPWLLKKLASHLLKQLQAGTSEESLLSESLNIGRLFEQDLAVLEATEHDALKSIAREAPVLVADIVERISPTTIQSLVDQRLVVRVGERIDIYWDTFREFLITGKVAVEDTFILRMRPSSTAKLLQYLVSKNEEVTATEAARDMSMSLHVVFNVARELRQLGILAPKPGSLLLSEQFRGGGTTENQIRERVARALRQHTVFKMLNTQLTTSPTHEVPVDTLAEELPRLFPAMEATPKTWHTYAVAISYWLDYSGLMKLKGQVLCPPHGTGKLTLLGNQDHGKRGKTFPHSRPKFAIEFLRSKVYSTAHNYSKSAAQKALTDLQVLGVLDSKGMVVDRSIATQLLDSNSREIMLRKLLAQVPGGRTALNLIETMPDARAEDVGAFLRDGFGLPWVASTVKLAGAKFRSWAKHAGIQTEKVRRPK